MSAAPTTEPSRLGKAALAYAARNWRVFPLVPGGKTPIVKRGFLEATADVTQVRAWWAQHPNANIGCAPGPSGFLVADIDGPDGETTAAGLGVLAEPTLVCTTGRADGGRHCWFRRPSFAVSNVEVGPKLDIRCDGGYVILPPSVHPSGRLYAWAGRIEEVTAIPMLLLEALTRAQSRAAGELATSDSGFDTPVQRAARDIPLLEEIGEGGRNNTLTRYAGRLLWAGMTAEEALALVQALNAAKCRPPLPPSEVYALVASIAAKDAAKPAAERRTSTGTTIVLHGQDTPAARPIATPASTLPAPHDVAAEQVTAARALLSRDLDGAPRWNWPDLSNLVGPMLPHDFVVVGSLMGNGKSTLLMSQMDAFASVGMPTLYLPLEIDPSVVRVRWAAWKLGLDATQVIRQDWAKLPEGARESVDLMLEELAADPCLHFATPKRITVPELTRWCQWGKEHAGVRVVMLDHLHRMDFGGDGAGFRVTVTDAVRRLKDLARELDLVLIAAAQLNRSNEPADAYMPPTLNRLKESAAIAEEADVVLMLSRSLKQNLPEKWTRDLQLGRITEHDIADPGVMVVTCRKHRLDDGALNRAARLQVVNGRLESAAPAWRTAPTESFTPHRAGWYEQRD